MTADTASYTFSVIAGNLIQNILNTVIYFFLNKLPLIIALGVSIGLIWFLLRKLFRYIGLRNMFPSQYGCKKNYDVMGSPHWTKAQMERANKEIVDNGW